MFKTIKSVTIAAAVLLSNNAFSMPKVVLNENNLVLLRGEVTSQSVAKVAQKILSSPEKELYLYISSPGGSVLAGRSLMYTIQNSGKTINCIVSVGASMAFAITQACTNRYVMPHSVLMQHVASYGLEGQDPNNRTFVKFITDMIHELDLFQTKRIGLSLEEFKKITRDDWWLFGENAVTANVADSLIQVSCSKELSQKAYKEKVTVFIFTVDVTWSACPLIEGPLKVTGDDDTSGEEAVKRMSDAAPDAETALKIKEFFRNLNVYEMIGAKFKKSTAK